MKGQTLFNPVDYDFNRRAPDPDTLTLTLTSTSTPDLAGYPRIIINVGSSTIVPLAPSPRCCADAAPAAHSISPSGGGGGRSQGIGGPCSGATSSHSSIRQSTHNSLACCRIELRVNG